MHAAFGAVAGMVLTDLRMHGAGIYFSRRRPVLFKELVLAVLAAEIMVHPHGRDMDGL